DGAHGGRYGVLQSAGLLFFAFAGYARVATLGQEVRDPRRTIPRAVVLSLATVVGLYAVVAVPLLAVLGHARLAASAAPLADAVAAGSWTWAGPVVSVGAVAASAGALLALLTGVSRTGLAMARTGDLPAWLAAVHPVHRVPHRAELAVGTVVVVLVLTTDLRGAIGFSSFGVLVYYLVANLSALRQSAPHRRYPRALQALGAVGCVALVVTLPLASVVAGAAVLAVGVALRAVRARAGPRTPRGAPEPVHRERGEVRGGVVGDEVRGVVDPRELEAVGVAVRVGADAVHELLGRGQVAAAVDDEGRHGEPPRAVGATHHAQGLGHDHAARERSHRGADLGPGDRREVGVDGLGRHRAGRVPGREDPAQRRSPAVPDQGRQVLERRGEPRGEPEEPGRHGELHGGAHTLGVVVGELHRGDDAHVVGHE